MLYNLLRTNGGFSTITKYFLKILNKCQKACMLKSFGIFLKAAMDVSSLVGAHMATEEPEDCEWGEAD